MLPCTDPMLTGTFLQRLQELMQRPGEDPVAALRIAVDSGGCSGFQYKFDLDHNIGPDDRSAVLASHISPSSFPSFRVLAGCIEHLEMLHACQEYLQAFPHQVGGCMERPLLVLYLFTFFGV